MHTPTDQQPERRKSVQQRYEEAQSRYSPVQAVIEQPDVPPQGKLMVALAASSIPGIVTLGISRAPLEAYGSLLICSLSFALFLNRTKGRAARAHRDRSTRPPQPRPRRHHQGKFRGST